MMRKPAQPEFSDDSIRQFLLGELREEKRAAFEFSLFFDRSLEERARLAEVALADDYVKGTLRVKERKAFVEKFPVSAARVRQIEVATALHERYAATSSPVSAKTFATFAHPAWPWAFATMILIMLFATIWLATKQPRIVQRFVPHPSRPAMTNPTPEVTHHAAHSAEPAAHRDQQTLTPGHELSSDTVVLDSITAAENAPAVTLATIRDRSVHVQLLLSETVQSTYLTSVMKSSGEVVYSEAEIVADANSDRVSFDLPIEHLAGRDLLQIKLTRTSDGKEAVYFLSVR